MSTSRWDLGVVARHPRVAELGRTAREQRRVEAFAVDLARWLVGEPRENLRPLARVVTVVAARELRDPRRLCRDRPLMAVESAARATEALWPYLRGPLDEDEPLPPPPSRPGPPGEPGPGGESGADAGEAGEGEGGDGEGEEEAEEAEGEGEGTAEGEADGEGEAQGDGSGEGVPEPGEAIDPTELLRELAGEGAEDLEDPDLAGLAEQLRKLMGDHRDPVEAGTEAGEELETVGEAALQAALETQDVAERIERFLPGVGWSTAPGALTGTLLERLDTLSQLLDDLEGLRELADRLGRMEEADRSEGRQDGGSEEVAGVRLSGDVSRALPSELALLSDPSTEDLFYQRLMEQRLVSLELTGSGLDGRGGGTKRGPVIACIDTSGSMQGAPELAAKALVLALGRKVLPQGRVMHLLLFGGPEDRTELRLKRGRGGLEQLLDFLSLSFQAGTDFDMPLLRAMELLAEEELDRADVLVVTDGLARASKPILDRVEEVKEARGARIYSVVLGHGDVRGVEPFSDEVHVLDPNDSAKALSLLRKVTGKRR
ncbi:MAG: VWA domain-containing protein [Deltaproteobacteria bacterium]|nr:MAG: VWA domain-containing protein [Deltaproteobacteria bacterium]